MLYPEVIGLLRMITVKKSTDGFVSYDENQFTTKEARKELVNGLAGLGAHSRKGGKQEIAVLRVTFRKKRPSPITAWTFEGPEEEITQLLATS